MRIGIGGPVGAGKTSLTAAVVKELRDRFSIGVITNDIYKLHIHSGVNGAVFYQNAFIPDYKTSVMMNNYFRIIKENENLDLLEESDDEEEFENINPDKFVYLNKQLNFECIYNKKFKKWVPIKKTNNKKIVNLTTIKSIVCNK